MSARVITTVLIVAAAISSLAAIPARADSNEEVKRILRTAAGLYIAGRILTEIDRNGGRVEVHDRRHHRHVHDRTRRGHGVHHAPRPGVHRTGLPRRCLVRVDRARTTYAFRGRCVQRHYRGASRLPQACQMWLGGRESRRWGYSARCLRGHGYRLAARY